MTSGTIIPSDRKAPFELQKDKTIEMKLQKNRISEFQNIKGYLYEDDIEAVDEFNKNVHYQNNINEIIDSDPLGLRRIKLKSQLR